MELPQRFCEARHLGQQQLIAGDLAKLSRELVPARSGISSMAVGRVGSFLLAKRRHEVKTGSFLCVHGCPTASGSQPRAPRGATRSHGSQGASFSPLRSSSMATCPWRQWMLIEKGHDKLCKEPLLSTTYSSLIDLLPQFQAVGARTSRG